MTDWYKIKREYVPLEQVPPPHTRGTSPWDEIFGSIPKGQALVLREPEVSSGTVRAALTRKHKEGKFKNIQFSSKGVHGSGIIYISNTEKPVEKTTEKPIQRWARPTTSQS
jgi:hypothetical protein